MGQPMKLADFWTDTLDGSIDRLTSAQLRDVALATLAARRGLDQALPRELIPDPVLDLLLTLFTLAEPGTAVANRVLFDGTTIAPPVADRYLRALEGYGFVACDAAAQRTALTGVGADRVCAALRGIVRSQIDFSNAVASRREADSRAHPPVRIGRDRASIRPCPTPVPPPRR